MSQHGADAASGERASRKRAARAKSSPDASRPDPSRAETRAAKTARGEGRPSKPSRARRSRPDAPPDPAPPQGAPALSAEDLARLDAEAAARGAQKSVAAVFGEMVWLLTQSPAWRTRPLSDLEVYVMPPLLARQFRLYSLPDGTPAALDLIAKVDAAAAARLDAGEPPRPADWTSGTQEKIVLRIVRGA